MIFNKNPLKKDIKYIFWLSTTIPQYSQTCLRLDLLYLLTVSCKYTYFLGSLAVLWQRRFLGGGKIYMSQVGQITTDTSSRSLKQPKRNSPVDGWRYDKCLTQRLRRVSCRSWESCCFTISESALPMFSWSRISLPNWIAHNIRAIIITKKAIISHMLKIALNWVMLRQAPKLLLWLLAIFNIEQICPVHTLASQATMDL
jgi:hypothetical protein